MYLAANSKKVFKNLIHYHNKDLENYTFQIIVTSPRGHLVKTFSQTCLLIDVVRKNPGVLLFVAIDTVWNMCSFISSSTNFPKCLYTLYFINMLFYGTPENLWGTNSRHKIMSIHVRHVRNIVTFKYTLTISKPSWHFFLLLKILKPSIFQTYTSAYGTEFRHYRRWYERDMVEPVWWDQGSLNQG